MKKVKIGILGLGTVGAGTAKLLQSNASEIQRKTGVQITVHMASVRNIDAERDCDCQAITLTQNPEDIVSNNEVDIVVETIGGVDFAKSLIEKALQNKKHVVTANKALIAQHGETLFALAQAQQVSLYYEAAVAGGIPIIKGLREGLAGNQIKKIVGIINGTSNFILTEMRTKGLKFEKVLAQAQELGYAEADPTFDIEGIDAAHKLTIMSAIGFGIPLRFDDVFTQGISELKLIDIAYAEELGYRIKHLGIAYWNAQQQGVELRVHPTLVPLTSLLANVEGVLNAVLVDSDAVGTTLHCGAGAGALPTASSVVADIIDIVRRNQTPSYGYLPEQINPVTVLPAHQFECAYYVRILVNDIVGVMSELTKVFADNQVNIEAITQKELQQDEENVSVIFLTQKTVEEQIQKVVTEFKKMDMICEEPVLIRVEHLS